jgi:hypothetical protein
VSSSVLADSAAYAVSENFRWPIGLDRAPREAKAFYGVIAVPIMVMMMLMARNTQVMGGQTIGPTLTVTRRLSTAAMAAAMRVLSRRGDP